ncbi:ROK family protein [Isoptericola sp. NPDC057559]|uniref:ROK family protein n=1 Tax=Isoptericola sp. NPDC057559 TaxID=3346168 RepID=UPI00367B4D61
MGAGPDRGLSVNERLVVDLLLDHGPLARPAIARAAALSRPATGDLVQRLLDRGLLVTAGEAETVQRGPNAMTYEVRRDLAHVAGVEMQPTRVQVAVADVTGAVVAEVEAEHGSGDRAEDLVARVLGEASAQVGISTTALRSVVVGTPGVVTPAGDIDFVSGHADWGAGQLARLESAVGAPVRLENDVNLAALAEQRLGAGRESRSFALMRCDEGLGVGIVLDGELLRGAHGYAGEVGYVPWGRPYGRPEAGFQSLVARARLADLLATHDVLDATPEEMLADPSRHPDVNATYLAEVAERFALLCLTVCAVLDPERLVLSGTVAAAGGERLTDAIAGNLHDMSPMRPAVSVTALGAGAVVAGAVTTALALAREELFGVPDRVPVLGVVP